MSNYAAEFVGTFFLVLTIGCTGIATGPGVIAPLAIGSVLMAMIYAGGPVSGAHYNPAVTLGAVLRGACSSSDVLPYVGAQIIGGLLAAATVIYLDSGIPANTFHANVGPAFVAELV